MILMDDNEVLCHVYVSRIDKSHHYHKAQQSRKVGFAPLGAILLLVFPLCFTVDLLLYGSNAHRY